MATIVTSATVPYNEDFNNVASVLRDLGAKFSVRPVENAESQRQIQFSKMTADAQAFIDALIVAHASPKSEVQMAEAEVVSLIEPEVVQALEETAQLEEQTVEAEIELVEKTQQETISYYTSSDLQQLTISQMRKLAKAQVLEITADVKKKPQLVKFLAGKLKF